MTKMVFIFGLILNSCAIHETSERSQEIDLMVAGVDRPANVEVEFSQTPGPTEDCWIRRKDWNKFQIKTPQMNGGWSELFGLFKVNEHNPETYEIIKVTVNKKVTAILSLKDIRDLKGAEKTAIFDVNKRNSMIKERPKD